MNANKSFCTLLLFGTLALPARAAAPRDELLRLIPDDVAFCLVVQDLRGHLTALTESPFVQQFRGTVAGKAILGSPEVTQLIEAEKFLKQHLDVDWKALRDDILGDAAVFAYRPGPAGKMEQDQGIFLVRARNPALLAGLVERLNKAQLKSGEVRKIEECEHRGGKYFRRVERDQPPTYYALRGPILAFTPHEDMLKRALELDREAKSADAEVPAIGRRLTQLGAERALLALWINPRAFDAELARKEQSPENEAERVFLRTFRIYWQALEGLVLSVVQQQGLEFNLALRVKPDGLPPSARKFLTEAAQRSELWSTFPPDAILAAAGRFDVAAFLQLFTEFLDDTTKKGIRDSIDQSAGPAMGKMLRDLLPSLGPDVGFCVLAPEKERGWFPDVLWATRVRSNADGKPAEQTLLDGLNFLAGLAVFDHNSKHADRLDLKSVQQDKLEVKFFVNPKQFPAGMQPAYTIKEGYLLFASSPEAVRRFQPGRTPGEASTEVRLMRLSCVALRNYLNDHRDALTAHVAEKNQIGRPEAAQRLERFLTALHFIDGLEWTQRPTAGQVILSLRVKPSQPLRK
ncbi:MAG: hypothetical protein JNM56_16530 [Planctomycetia bacterium]|nr:hypothetical protein [Planctomycetia bacterium]